MSDLPNRLAMFLLLALAVPAAHAQEAGQEVGRTLLARGAVTAQLGGEARLVNRGAAVYQGEVLSSGRGSFAVIEYSDGTRMTLRPNSQLRIEHFDTDEGEESALVSLFKGGIRAITGFIAGRNPEGFNVRTNVATIGIRGTDFAARLCDADCREEQRAATRRSGDVRARPTATVVARVAFVNGTLEALGPSGETRRMLPGASVYPGDRLRTPSGAFAVVAFPDSTRLTLQAASELVVENVRYAPGAGVESGALLRLTRGGLRVITGLIGRERPEAFRIETPIATITAREARFSVYCTAGCADLAAARRGPEVAWAHALLQGLVRNAHAQPTSGMLIAMQDGELTATFLATGRTATLSRGEVGRLQPDGGLQRLSVLPAGLPDAGLDPADVPFDPTAFQSQPLPEETEGALIVTVFDDGHAVVRLPDGSTLDIGQDEAVFADGSRVLNVAGGTPAFITRDPYNINPADFDEQAPLSGVLSEPGETEFECTVQ